MFKRLIKATLSSFKAPHLPEEEISESFNGESFDNETEDYLLPCADAVFQYPWQLRATFLDIDAPYYLICEGPHFNEWEDYYFESFDQCFDDLGHASVDIVRRNETCSALHVQHGYFSPNTQRLYIALDVEQYETLCDLKSHEPQAHRMISAFVDHTVVQSEWFYKL